MRFKAFVTGLLILLAVACPSLAQGWAGSTNEDTCFKCPYCGYETGPLSYEEVQYVINNPYDPMNYCPACGTYGGYFNQIPCDQNAPYEPLKPQPNITENGVEEPKDDISVEESQIPPKGLILMVVPQNNYQEMEFDGPKAIFEQSGYTVEVASKGEKAIASNGANLTIDHQIRDVNLTRYEAVVFVGGDGVDELKLYQDTDYLNLAKKVNDAGLIEGAICLAPKILAGAGVLKDRNATSSDPSGFLESKGAKVVNLDVVRDGYIITANGPYAANSFAQEVVAAINDKNAPISLSDMQGALRVPVVEDGGGASDLTPSYKCPKCAYVYDPAIGDPDNGIAPGTPFSELPSDWKCPWCNAPKSGSWTKVQ